MAYAALKIKINMDGIANAEARLGQRVLPRAAARAANRTAGNARSKAAQSLKSEGSDRAIFLKAFAISRAKSAAVATAMLAFKGGINLSDLKHEITEISTSRGLRLGVRVYIGDQSVIVPGAFVATMPSGHEGIFIRKNNRRLPIREMKAKELLGSSEETFMRNPKVQEALRRGAEASFKRNFEESYKSALDALA